MQFIYALFIPIFFILETHFVFGASFDCSKASTKTEKAICDNEEISLLDEQLGKLYSMSRKTVFSQVEEEQKNIINNIKSRQKEWILGTQQGCNADVSCLKRVYIDRIGEFRQLLGIFSADQQSGELEERDKKALFQETKEQQNNELELLEAEKLSKKQGEKDKKEIEKEGGGIEWWVWLIIIFLLYGFWKWLQGGGYTNKRCAWCDANIYDDKKTELKFLKGEKGGFFWEYRNKDGSQDKRVKDNRLLASYTSEFECPKCSAVTKFKHYVDENPSANVHVWKRTLIKKGTEERTGTDWENEEAETVRTRGENRKNN